MKFIATLLILLGLTGLGIASYIYTQLSYIDWPYVNIGLLLVTAGLWGFKKAGQRNW